MNVLVTYSSGYGSTKEVAEKIAGVLKKECSITITISSIDVVEEIDQYDGIVIGSSVRADLPLANVRDFLARERRILPLKKVAFFAVCLAAACEDGRMDIINNFINPLFKKYPDIHLIESEAFAGKVNFEQMNPVMQELTKTVLKRKGIDASSSVDIRNWDYIEAWSKNLCNKLNN